MRHTFATLFLLLAAFAQGQVPHALKIGPGDLLNIEVFDVPELKQEVRVTDSGEADLTLVGQLHLAGLTAADASRLIAAELQKHDLVPKPQVHVFIREYVTQGVTVAGEVRRPGVYQVLVPKPLTQVISEAGGATELASSRVIVRRHQGGEESIAIPRNQNSSSVMVYPGDFILVQRAGVAYLVGDVARSGGYVLQNDGELSVAQLVSLGGGLIPTAKSTHSKLIRKTASGRDEVELNVAEILRGRAPDVALQPDDILFIPNSAWKSASNRLQNITQMTIGAAIYSGLN